MNFEEIYKIHYPEMRKFAFMLNVVETEKDDLIQDVFVKLYYEFQNKTKIDNPRAWLYKAMLNKSRSNHKTIKLHLEKNKDIFVSTINFRDLNDEIEHKEKRKIVLQTINQMSDKDKEILLLYYDGFSYAEIAEITEINFNSIGTTLVRAIQKIKNTLKLQYNEMFE